MLRRRVTDLHQRLHVLRVSLARGFPELTIAASRREHIRDAVFLEIGVEGLGGELEGARPGGDSEHVCTGRSRLEAKGARVTGSVPVSGVEPRAASRGHDADVDQSVSRDRVLALVERSIKSIVAAQEASIEQ